MDSLGGRIRRARERARMTQRELAQALAVDSKTVDNWENGRTKPKRSLGAIEQVLGPHGFAVDTVGPPQRPAGDRSAVKQIRLILDSEIAGLTAETKLAMIRDVIALDAEQDEPAEQPEPRRASG